MNKKWPKVKLEEVLRKRKEFVPIDDLATYKRPRVQLHAKGIVLRDEVPGALIKTKKQQVCQSGELLVAEIDAKVGGFGIVPEFLDSAIVSSHYFLFSIDESKLNRRYLDFFIRTPAFFDQIKAQGSTNYAAIRPSEVLDYQIPLPPLTEQRRIVARIEELAAQINEARILRQQAVGDVKALIMVSVSNWCFSNRPVLKFGEFLAEAKNGIYKAMNFWGNGHPCLRMYNIDGPRLNQKNLQLLDVSAEEMEIYGCQAGDLVFNRVNSAELVGKTGLVTEEFPQCTFESKNMRLRVDRSYLLPEFAAIILNSTVVRTYYREVLKQQCGMATLNQGHVRNIPFPQIEISEQIRIVKGLNDLQAEVDRLQKLQTETSLELDALLPSILDKAFKGEL
jgi:type I restriction enzyme S subunit